MNLACISLKMHPRRPFRISRGWRSEVRNVFVRIERDGISGYGEAAPINYYDETWQSVMSKIEGARDYLASFELHSVTDIERAWIDLWSMLAPSRAAQCALDLALWDWLSRRRGVSACELAWNAPARPVTTFCTIGLSDQEELIAKVGEARDFPRIKIKASRDASLDAVRYARAQTNALLAVDANCAWETADLLSLSQELAALGVAFIEQPFPPARDAELSKSSARLPLMADESCVTEDDVDRAVGRYSGCNIKLVKSGGITPALRMARRCRALGLQSMVGCMLESSALISAGAVVAQGADHADLDGAWLLSDDPFAGWTFDCGILHPPTSPGLGLTPRGDWFPKIESTGL
jgi:L-alanine-DL-glutamate epimerase-like enolase superfamily enzyme